VESRFELVILAARRAKMLMKGASPQVESTMPTSRFRELERFDHRCRENDGVAAFWRRRRKGLLKVV
jgi:hypothetical protein